MPAGAVFEWNLVSLYAAFFLFVGHPHVTVLDIDSLPLALYLVVGLILLPLIGNLVPARVSFLVAMRYYAGNWAWNAWLFRGDSHKKLDRLKRASPLFREQLERFAPAEAASMDSRGMAFRSLHLQGRTPRPAAAEGDRRSAVPGVPLRRRRERRRLGPRLELRRRPPRATSACSRASRQQCDFEDGELRAIMVESQPLLGSTLHWRIVDAKRGLLDEGYAHARRARPARALGLRRGLTHGRRRRRRLRSERAGRGGRAGAQRRVRARPRGARRDRRRHAHAPR